MGTIDSVLYEAESRYGISRTKGAALLSGVLTFIQEQTGGLREFIERFRRAGLGDTVSSWFSGGTSRITTENVESVFGRDTIDRLASKSGLSFAAASSALALMIPRLIPQLAPGGSIPTHLPSELLSDVDRSARAMNPLPRPAATAIEPRRSGISSLLWVVLGLIALLLIGLWLRSAHRATAFNAEEAARIAQQKATAAVAALTPGFSKQDLVNALNLEVFNFASASAQIPSESYDFLSRTATAMKSAPAGTIVQISGYTDNTGDAQSNLQLSQQRADSVRDYLVGQGVDQNMLVAKGYGDSKPVATNDTDEGKFRNRRIEFTVLQ